MARYSDTVRDQNLAPVPGVKVYVALQDGSVPELTTDGGEVITQPLISDEYGAYTFNADDDFYDISFYYGSRLVQTNEGVPVGDPYQQFVGPPGPAGPTHLTLAAFKAAPTSNQHQALKDPSIPFGDFYWTLGNFTGQADDENIIKADSTALSVGAWVRQKADQIVDAARSSALSAPDGSSLVGFQQNITGAEARTLEGKAAEIVSVLDFGADPTGVLDSTAAFNLATSAATHVIDNDTPVKRLIRVPAGKYKINGRVYVHKGQTLSGDGRGASMIDATGAGALGEHVFTMGQASDGTHDEGGLFCEIRGLLIEGGPLATGKALIDTSNCAGWAVSQCTFLNCSIGLRAGGGEGVVENCYFDINTGQTGLECTGQNIQISDCQFYIGFNQIRLLNGTHNVLISNCEFVYPKISSIYLDIGATIRRVVVDGCTFGMNVQYDTHIGFIHFASNASDMTVNGCVFSNGYGGAIRYSTGIGASLVVTGSVFDGLRTTSGYDQSTTFKAWDGGNMNATFSGCAFRNLPGQPLEFGGGAVTSITRVKNCVFENNTGGTVEIQINDTNAGSEIYLNDNTASRPLINAQSTVPVYAPNIAFGQATLVAGIVTVNNTLVRASSRIWVQRQTDGGTVGASYSVGRTAGTSFTVFAKDGAGAAQAGDISVLNWQLDLNGA